MRQKRKSGEVTVYSEMGLLFLLLLFGFGILNFFHKDRAFSETENRMLEQMPKVQLSEVADGRFMRSFENYQTDQFVGRESWIRIRTMADQMLGKNESDGVYLGRNGQLYEEPAQLCEQVWENLDAIRSFSGRYSGINHYLILVPGAAGVTPEQLPPFAPVEDQKGQLEQIYQYLDGAVQEIPVWDILKEHETEYLYYRTDHHWTTLGAYYAFCQAQQVMGLEAEEKLQEDILQSFYTVTDSFEGTLSSKSGYQVQADTISVYWPEKEERLAVTYVEEQQKSASLYASEKLENKDKYGVFLNGNHPLVDIRTMAESPRRLLLIKDSYANCFVPFLTSRFREIVLVDPRYYYGDLEELIQEKKFTDVLFLYNLNTFLEDDVLHFVLEDPAIEE